MSLSLSLSLRCLGWAGQQTEDAGGVGSARQPASANCEGRESYSIALRFVERERDENGSDHEIALGAQTCPIPLIASQKGSRRTRRRRKSGERGIKLKRQEQGTQNGRVSTLLDGDTRGCLTSKLSLRFVCGGITGQAEIGFRMEHNATK